MLVEFEFDERKSEAKKAKHGIDFVQAQAMWLDEMRVEIPAHTEDEPRSVVIGMIGAGTGPRSSRSEGSESG